MATERLNAQDEYFLDADTLTAPTHIGGLEIYRLPEGEGRDYIQKLYQHLRKSPVRAEPFNFKLSSVVPEAGTAEGLSLAGRLRRRTRPPKPVRVWTKVRVNADEHIYLHALPRPGGQRELGELVSRLHVNRLDRSRPLWEVHLIEGLEGGRFALYTKLHHSQFDGKRGMELSNYVRSTDPGARGMPPMWAVDLKKARGASKRESKSRRPAPSKLQTLASWGTAAQKVGTAIRGGYGAGVTTPYTAPSTILNGPLTSRRRVGTQSLPLGRMKALGAAVPGGATVNEVLLAICGGALRRYLRELKALPSAPLIAACPVAISRKEDKASGNAVGQISVSLGTHVADPRKRLLSVVASSRANKDVMLDVDADTYMNYLRLLMIPQVLVAKTAYAHRMLNANLVISNIPGPRETQYVNGARLEAMYSTSLLLPGQALNITVANFGDSLDMGILACPDLCPSPQRIAVYAGEELEVLERAMGLRPAAGGAKRVAPQKRAAATTKPSRSAPARPGRKSAASRKAR